MGYENPIVSKEVYLPTLSGWDEAGLTFEEYKEKYGIDIETIFNITSENLELKPHYFAKIYFVSNYFAFSVGMLNRIVQNPSNDNPKLFRVMSGDADYGIGLDIDIGDRTIKHFEI